MVMSRPVSVRARSRNSSALAASRQASVAIRPERATRCRLILAAHTLQRVERALDGGLRQPAARRDALAEADDAREGVDHLEAAPRGPRHQQPAVVGAEIERGVGGPGSGAPRRRSRGGSAVAATRSRRTTRPRRQPRRRRARLARHPPRNRSPAARSTAAPSWSFVPSTVLLRRPVCNPAGPSGVILVELGLHSISSQPRVKAPAEGRPLERRSSAGVRGLMATGYDAALPLPRGATSTWLVL